jgi:hypothetical protein
VEEDAAPQPHAPLVGRVVGVAQGGVLREAHAAVGLDDLVGGDVAGVEQATHEGVDVLLQVARGVAPEGDQPAGVVRVDDDLDAGGCHAGILCPQPGRFLTGLTDE